MYSAKKLECKQQQMTTNIINVELLGSAVYNHSVASFEAWISSMCTFGVWIMLLLQVPWTWMQVNLETY